MDPFTSHEFPPTSASQTAPSTKTLSSWSRCRGAMSDSRTSHLAVLACLTDAWFLNSIPRMNPAAMGQHGEQVVFMATLNNTVWFHDPNARLDTWLFMERGTSWAASDRCLMDQKIWNQDGKLVATCVQEGALRLKKDQHNNSVGEQNSTGSKL